MRDGAKHSEAEAIIGSGLRPEEREAINIAAEASIAYREGLPSAPARPTVSLDEAVARVRTGLSEHGQPADDVIRQMVTDTDGALHQMAAPTFFGYVLGSSHPVGVAADMLVSAWGQNVGSSFETPAMTGMERAVCDWVLDLLGLPDDFGAGIGTGATLANTTGMAAARHALLEREGWDVEANGLFGAPEVNVLIGDGAHSAPFAGLRYIGFGANRVTRVAADEQGCIRPEAFEAALVGIEGPVLAVLQAGQINSGGFDPFHEIIPMLREKPNTWAHVDGAFGLWQAAVPGMRDRLAGYDLADSWAVDLHKWLNAPFDAGMVICRDRAPLVASMSARGAYLPELTDHWEPTDSTFELSRRARGVPSYAILRMLGKSGVREMIARHCDLACRLADQLSAEPGLQIMNKVVGSQVAIRCGSGADAEGYTNDVLSRVQARERVYPTHGVWHADGRAIIRASIIGYSMYEPDVDLLAEEIISAWREIR